MFYRVKGDGEPLLLIAGFACDHTYWSSLVPALAARYRVVVFDNRGVGRSPELHASVTIRELAEDAAQLLDTLGLDRVHVAGHSMGGMIAQELVLAHPERVAS